MREFNVPATDTKVQGEVGLEYAFTVTLDYDGPYLTETARGTRIYKGITGGTIAGRINGTVYPDGGGEFPVRRADGVDDVRAHIVLKAENGEWLYLWHLGYGRPDGYYRVTAFVDADQRGAYTWTQGSVFLGTADESADGKRMTITYYEAV